ncbi:hypothetical protein [Ureibacillus manganicus]|uniref:Lipoprotein n=1 Tax=Ureibacillus manganicus DSM 26584 TaxID=1384049 RepID=A0A0A3IW78_9BACL|nr:hypothetical protein [Ureibacillus manganicus]KGR79082.1 hypothetical protein CD29_08755 [Ureibacillus manganicus DSM 26584]
MKKRDLSLIALFMLIGTIFGCSANKGEFDDKNIIFNVIKTETATENKFYKIEISNETGFDLTHLTFNLSYPIKTSNGSKSNPYVVEGKTDDIRPINLKSGEPITFSIYTPIQEVFANSNLLDFENPDIELEGYFKEGQEEIQFGIYGGLSVLVN